MPRALSSTQKILVFSVTGISLLDMMKYSIVTINQSQNQVKSMYRISKISSPSDNISSSTYSFHHQLIHLAVVRHTPSASRLTAEANGSGEVLWWGFKHRAPESTIRVSMMCMSIVNPCDVNLYFFVSYLHISALCISICTVHHTCSRR